MEETKRILIADFDEMGRFGTKLALRELKDIEIMTAATKDEALAIINGDKTPDLVIVDPMKELFAGRNRGTIDVTRGTFGVMTAAVEKNIRLLIITTLPEEVEQDLYVIGMRGEKYKRIIGKAKGSDVVIEAVRDAFAA